MSFPELFTVLNFIFDGWKLSRTFINVSRTFLKFVMLDTGGGALKNRARRFLRFGVVSLARRRRKFLRNLELACSFLKGNQKSVSPISRFFRACGAPFSASTISYKEFISDFFSGNAVFINKLDIRAWPYSGGKEARADANMFINFGWP